jgi:rhomboid family GlyGly-CTERM serine protease
VSRYLPFLLLGAVAVAVFAAGSHVAALLLYQRAPILRGELWRLLSTYLVHAGIGHLLWNLAATALVALAVGRAFRAGRWWVVALVAGIGSSLAVLALHPDVRAMSGLSGLLHGLWAAGATAEVRRGERAAWLLLGLLALKIAWEQLAGPAGGSALGGRIAVHAHAYGALGGLLTGFKLSAGAAPPPRPE